MSTDAISGADEVADEAAPTTELVTGVVGDRCANCQAPLAADQRYCVNCGERRGRARFSPDTLTAQTDPVAAASRPPRQTPSWVSSGATMVAGVATLLIALGVGVLIGHNSSSSSPARAPAAQIITVGGGASGTGAATGTRSAATRTTTATRAQRAAAKHAKPTVVHVTAKVQRAATSAASKVLGSSNNLSKNVQQSIGGSCSGGAGCQNGKFTGNFFPTG